VTSNKYLLCDRGLYELKFFFRSGVAADGGEGASAEAVKAAIGQLIADETDILSDDTLVDLLELAQEIVNRLARRAVTVEVGMVATVVVAAVATVVAAIVAVAAIILGRSRNSGERGDREGVRDQADREALVPDLHVHPRPRRIQQPPAPPPALRGKEEGDVRRQ
jgi:hypothetical protein